MISNDQVLVLIEKLDYFGRGIGRVDNKIIFVDNCLPGDLCEVKIVDVKKNYLIGEVVEIKESSKDRVSIKCPYYNSCGGCHIMSYSYDNQLEYKKNKVKELFYKNAKLDIDISNINYDTEFNYRNKVIFHGDKNALGFYKEKTNDVVEIDKCIITNSKINDIYYLINNYVSDNKCIIYSIMFRITSNNKIMLDIKGDIDVDFLNSLDVDTIYLNDKLITGDGYLVEDIFGLKFKIYPKSFFQVNYEVMKKMYQKVIDFYKDKKYNNVLDLYCGTGTMGMLISKYVNKVIGVEIEHSAILSALECSKLNNIENITFKEGKVEKYIDSFKNIDSVIVDPPRSGLDKYTIDTLLKISPKTILYISCDPATLTRDINLLSTKYDLDNLEIFDMFPNTYHVECVCILKLK